MEYEYTVNSGGVLQMDLQQRSVKVKLKRIEPEVANETKEKLTMFVLRLFCYDV